MEVLFWVSQLFCVWCASRARLIFRRAPVTIPVTNRRPDSARTGPPAPRHV